MNELTKEEKTERTLNSFWKYRDNKEWCKNRGLKISKSKKGKETNQTEITGKRYASMTDEEFDNFLKTVSPRVHNRARNLRQRYKKDGSSDDK